MFPPFATPQGFLPSEVFTVVEEKDALWFLFAGEHLLLSAEAKQPLTQHDFPLEKKLFMGTFDGKHLFAAEVKKEFLVPEGVDRCLLRSLYGVLSEDLYALAGRAVHLLYWDKTHTHCGCCGHLTFVREVERCRECSSCGHLFYPKLAPAIMALVKKEDKILLARSPHFPENMYSVLAGFLDGGETLEQCVAREVWEEVGVRVKNIRYFGSQPWPFSQSLMIGFLCDWESGEINIDPKEIEAAAWFGLDDLPEIPSFVSLARFLIDSQRP